MKNRNPLFSILLTVFVATACICVSSPQQNGKASTISKTIPRTRVIHNF